jgi:hypothetical protein
MMKLLKVRNGVLALSAVILMGALQADEKLTNKEDDYKQAIALLAKSKPGIDAKDDVLTQLKKKRYITLVEANELLMARSSIGKDNILVIFYSQDALLKAGLDLANTAEAKLEHHKLNVKLANAFQIIIETMTKAGIKPDQEMKLAEQHSLEAQIALLKAEEAAKAK